MTDSEHPHARPTLGLLCVLAVMSASWSCGSSSDPDRPWSMGEQDVSKSYTTTVWSDESFEATDLQFLPDGRAIVITKGGWAGPGSGAVHLLGADGAPLGKLLDVPVCTDAERGLVGLAIDPDFESHPLIYLAYTRQMSDCAVSEKGIVDVTAPVWNRVSTFVFDDQGIDPATEQVLIDELPAHQSSHVAGGLAFLADGTLLVATGEATLGLSREVDELSGKILRIDVRRGGVGAAGNPHENSSDSSALTFASGLRNPFRIAVDPQSQVVAVADVGTDDFEEVNVIVTGGDYGFPTVEGPSDDDDTTPPALWYRHEQRCSSIIGGSFVPASFVPDGDRSFYTFSDLVCGGVWAVSFEGVDADRLLRLSGQLDRYPAALRYGPDDALYLINIGPGAQPITRMARTA